MRKWIFLLVVLLLLLGGAGVFLLTQRAERVAGQVDEARQARTLALESGKAEDVERALALFEEIYRSQPTNESIVSSIFELRLRLGVLDAERREELYDSVQTLAEQWMTRAEATGGDPSVAYRALIDLALRRYDLDEAERLAGEAASLDPALSMAVRLGIHELRGDEAARTEVVETAVSLAAVSTQPLVQAEYYTLAAGRLGDFADDRAREAKALREAAQGLEGDAKAARESQAAALEQQARNLRDRARRLLEGARKALADAKGTDTTQEERDDIRARMDLLAVAVAAEPGSDDRATRDKAEAQLRQLLLEADDLDPARRNDIEAALVRTYMEREEWDEVGRFINRLAVHSYPKWLESLRRYAEIGPPDRVLTYVEREQRREAGTTEMSGDPARSRYAGNPLTDLVRAQVLQRIEGRRADAAAILAQVAAARGRPELALQAAALYRQLGLPDEAARVLRDLPDDPEARDARVDALLAAWQGGEGAPALIARAAAQAGETPEVLQIVRLLEAEDPATLEAFLAAPLGEQGPATSRRRLARATAAALRHLELRGLDAADRTDEAAARAALLGRAALADLEVLLEAPADKSTLMRAFLIAAALDAVTLGGRLVGRALGMEEGPHTLGYSLLQMAARAKDDEVREKLVSGLREAAEAPGAARAFLLALADAIGPPAAPRAETLTALDRAKEEERSALPSLFLIVRLAFEERDLDASERAAQALVRRFPRNEEARELLGDLRLRRGDVEGVLDVWEGVEPTGGSFHPYRQRSDALWSLDRRTEAIQVLRDAVKTLPRDPDVHVRLARRLLRQDYDPEEMKRRGRDPKYRERMALGTLSVAPVNDEALLLRGQILLDLEHYVLAEMVFNELIRRAPNNIDAWRGAAMALTRDGRGEEADRLLTAMLAPRWKLTDRERTELAILRGMVREQTGNWEGALADYEAALQAVPDSPRALNNAAWLLYQHRKSQIRKAQGYAAKAVAQQPDQPELLDTLAHIEQDLGNTKEALDLLLRRVELLGKAQDLRGLQETLAYVNQIDSSSEAARRARALLDTLEGSRAGE